MLFLLKIGKIFTDVTMVSHWFCYVLVFGNYFYSSTAVAAEKILLCVYEADSPTKYGIFLLNI